MQGNGGQRRRSTARWALVALLWLGLCASAAAQDRVTARAYWIEPCVPTALEHLPREAFVPYTGLLSLGYSRCAVWVRLRLAPAGVDAQTVLRLRPSYLDEIALHDPLLLPAVRVAGDRHPDASDARSRAITFNLPGGEAPREIFLRLSTTSTRLLEVQGLSPAAALAQDRREDWAQGLFLAMLAGTLLWALVQWIHVRERVLGVFVARQAVALAWVLALLGYGPGLLGGLLAPPALDRLTSVLVLGVVAASVWFDRAMLTAYQVPRWGLRLLAGLAAMLAVELALLYGGRAALALQINTAIAWLAVLLTCAMFWVARPGQPCAAHATLPARWLAWLYLLILGSLSLAAGSQLGLVRGGAAALSALYVHTLLTSVVMLVLLNVRSVRQARALRELAAAQARAEQEREHREHNDRLMDMLLHEMKTPLATVSMLLDERHLSARAFEDVQRSLADMSGLLDRCAQASQLEGGGLQPQWVRCDLWRMLQDIAGRWRDAARLDLALSPELMPAHVLADPQWLQTIVGNLLDNACKYSPADSRVQIFLGPRTDTHDPAQPRAGVALDIANLPGAAGRPDALQLFHKYYRSPFARRTTGSGLGLYLVAGLTLRMNGRLSYEPTPEMVRFRLWLPA